jgi:hypothetical protein
VYEGRGVERVITPPPHPVPVRHLAELVVDQGEQGIEGLPVPLSEARKQVRGSRLWVMAGAWRGHGLRGRWPVVEWKLCTEG